MSKKIIDCEKLIDRLNVEELAENTKEDLQAARFILSEREKIPEQIFLLELLAHTRFATFGQLSRILPSGDNDEKCRLIEILLKEDLIGKIGNICIQNGRYRNVKTSVLFLTSRGRKSLKFYFPKTAHYAKVGFPDRVSHCRINHQLLTAEAYLEFHRTVKVLKCENEDILKADFEIENAKRTKQGAKPRRSQGGFPDLKISYLYKDTRIATTTIEACVKLSRKQINRKSSQFEWYVYDELTFSHVWREKGEYATIADDVLSPLEVEQYFRPKPKLKKADETDIKATVALFLDSMGGGATKRLLKKVTGLKDTKLRNELDKLIAEKFLMKTETCLIAGTSRGRNVNFYYLPESDSEANFLPKQVIRSYATEEMIDKGYRSYYVDAYGVVVFRSVNDPDQGALLLTDFETSTFTGERLGFWNDKHINDYECWTEYEGETLRAEKNEYFYASTNLQGIFSVKEIASPHIEVIDLSATRQAQSYRYGSELSPNTITRDSRRRVD